MVQYGFPAPPNVPLERPLCGSDALVRDTVAVAMEEGKETAGAATAAAAAGEGVVGGGDAGGLPAAAAQEEEEERGSRGALSEAGRVGLMNELFLRAQQRFAREAGGHERRFEIGVSLFVVGPVYIVLVVCSGRVFFFGWRHRPL